MARASRQMTSSSRTTRWVVARSTSRDEPAGAIGQFDLGLAQRQQIDDARLQLGGIEGLVDKVGCPGAKGLEPGFLVDIGGDHDDGHQAIAFHGAQGGGDLDAVHFGHDMVDQHQIVLLGFSALDRFERMLASIDLRSHGIFDDRSDHRKAGPAIVNYEHPHFIASGFSLRKGRAKLLSDT